MASPLPLSALSSAATSSMCSRHPVAATTGKAKLFLISKFSFLSHFFLRLASPQPSALPLLHHRNTEKKMNEATISQEASKQPQWTKDRGGGAAQTALLSGEALGRYCLPASCWGHMHCLPDAVRHRVLSDVRLAPLCQPHQHIYPPPTHSPPLPCLPR